MASLKAYSKEEKGVVLIEFAFVFPVFLLFITGIMEFGYLLWGYSALEYGASYGARYAFVNPQSSSRAIETAAMSKLGVNSSAFTYTATVVPHVYVDIDGTFSYTFLFLPLKPITLKTHVHQLLPVGS